MDPGRDRLLSWPCHRERHSCHPDHGSLYPGEPGTSEREAERTQGIIWQHAVAVSVKASTAHLLSAIWSRYYAHTCSSVSSLDWPCKRFGHPSSACRSSRKGAGRRGSDFWRCWHWQIAADHRDNSLRSLP